MKSFATALLALILAVLTLASCVQATSPPEKPAQVQTPAASPSQSDKQDDITSTLIPSSLPPGPSESPEPVVPPETPETPETLESPEPPEQLETPPTSPAPADYPDIPNLDFADLDGMVFTFASGAGAWCTEVKIMPDGTFSGFYYDADMGDTDFDYPNGTYYFCNFGGKFSPMIKTGDYEYSMKCESITQEGIAEEVEIGDDGYRYIISRPYGFDDADGFFLYLPGKKTDELPEEFITWVSMPRGIDPASFDVLPFYGLYNIEGKQGFSN